LELENPQLLRIVAYKLEEMKQLDLCEQIFRQVLKLRPDEPQSYRDLALVLHKKGQVAEPMKLLYQVVLGKWDYRYDDIELTALIELNRIISFWKQDFPSVDLPVKIDSELITPMDLDLRIVMAWDTNDTDIDLHVTEPNLEHCFYGHQRTALGGLCSTDFIYGYGK
jgi:Ca-activated chloride channel family protein